jgi:hypothetical protein
MIEMAQESPAARLAGHALLRTKSLLLTAAAPSVSAIVPVF